MLDPNAQLQDIGKAAQTAFAKQNEPIVSRENAPILKRNALTGKLEVEFAPAPKLGEGFQYDFGTGTVGVAKGFPEALTKITTTKGEAEGENKIETKMIGGREVTGTVKQLKAILTGFAKTPEDAKSALTLATGAGINVGGISVILLRQKKHLM